MPRRTSLPPDWAELASRLGSGSVSDLAEELGTPPRTLYGWAHRERVPSGTAARAIVSLFEAHGLRPPELKTRREA